MSQANRAISSQSHSDISDFPKYWKGEILIPYQLYIKHKRKNIPEEENTRKNEQCEESHKKYIEKNNKTNLHIVKKGSNVQ